MIQMQTVLDVADKARSLPIPVTTVTVREGFRSKRHSRSKYRRVWILEIEFVLQGRVKRVPWVDRLVTFMSRLRCEITTSLRDTVNISIAMCL